MREPPLHFLPPAAAAARLPPAAGSGDPLRTEGPAREGAVRREEALRGRLGGLRGAGM